MYHCLLCDENQNCGARVTHKVTMILGWYHTRYGKKGLRKVESEGCEAEGAYVIEHLLFKGAHFPFVAINTQSTLA